MFHLTAAISILIFAFLAVRSYVRKRRDNPAGLPLPPGPPRLPIVGNLLGIKDLGAQWLTFAEWSKKYGRLPGFLLSVMYYRDGILTADVPPLARRSAVPRDSRSEDIGDQL